MGGLRLGGDNDAPTDSDGTLLTWAKALSTIWLFSLAVFVAVKWQKITSLEPNEVGDYLAGAFAPLAFSWLVVAVFLQREELQAQRKELEQNREALLLQANELKNSVEQLARQTEIFSASHASEQERSVQEEIERKLDQLVLCHKHLNLRMPRI